MDKINTLARAKYSLDRLVTNSLSGAAVGLPGAVARLNITGTCLETVQGPSQQVFGGSTVVARNEVIVADAQPQLLSPIETIPVELFQLIMVEVVKEYPPLSIPDYYHALTQMRLVCRRWTGALETMSSIWVNISLSMDERLINLALSRSMPSALTITGYLFSSPALDKLLQHVYRWKYLDIYLNDEVTMDCLVGHSAPLLEEMRLDHLLQSSPVILFNGSAPMLRIIHIRNSGVQWGTSVLSNLHELVLVDVQEGVPDVETFLKILSNSPQLIRLRVRHTHLTHSPSPQTRVSLSYLTSLELEYLGQGILKQLVESIDIPASTKCWFSIAFDDYQSTSLYEQLEPIGRRLTNLADTSRGTRSTLAISSERNGWNVRMTYEGEAHQLGTLTIDVEVFPRSTSDVFEYFACQLGQGEPNPVPPIIHIVNPPYLANFDNQSEILQRLYNHLPDTDEILVEDGSFRSIEDVFNTLFPLNPSSRPFPHLSTLIIRESIPEKWANWLLGRQKRCDGREGMHPLPLKTLKVEGGTISAEKVKGLEKLVSNLLLDRVDIE